MQLAEILEHSLLCLLSEDAVRIPDILDRSRCVSYRQIKSICTLSVLVIRSLYTTTLPEAFLS